MSCSARSRSPAPCAALAPARIGHGVQAVEDPAVLATLADRGIACEVCPASNVALGVVEGLGAVPLRTLEAAGRSGRARRR